MKIAICDDDNKFLFDLKSKIYDYSNLHNWESVVDTYESGQKLIDSHIKYDIIILDYQMDTIDGLETAKQLRKGINSLTCIIFLTSYPEVAISAYDVDTYRFVVKNSLYDGLYRALDNFRKIVKLDYGISIKSDNERFTINTHDIVFIEVQNKHSYLHLSNGKIICTRTTLTDLYKEIPHTHFFKIHKSFVVNFKYIIETGSTYIKIKNSNYVLPISRNYASAFKKSYYNFLKQNKI